MTVDHKHDFLLDSGAAAGLFLLAVLISGPWGDFPINDDWSWAIATRRLLEDHVWRPTGWTSMTLLTHAGWGAMFCVVAGDCSDGVLRWATIVAATLGLIAAYALAWEMGLERWRRLLLVGALATSPLFFGLSVTYMTDITFLAMATVSAIFMVRSVKSDSVVDAAVGTVLTVVAILNRQMALIVPFGFLTAAMLRPRASVRRIGLAAVPLLISATVLVLFNRWMEAQGVTPAMYKDPSNMLVRVLTDPVRLAKNLVLNGGSLFLYVGIFCLPMLIARGAPKIAVRPLVRYAALAASALAVAMMGACIYKFGPMPVSGNVLTRVGFGPHVIQPYQSPDYFGPDLHGALMGFWWLLTAAAIVGGAMAVSRLVIVSGSIVGLTEEPVDSQAKRLEAFVFAAIVAYCGPMVVAGYFDRYLLPLLLLTPLVGAALPAAEAPKWARGAAFGLVVFFGLLSIGWAHDEMSWQRARWAAINRLQAAGVPPGKLDGGFEYNAQRCYVPVSRCTDDRADWAPILDPAYVVAFEPQPGYGTVFTIEYSTWLPMGRHKIWALKRDGEDRATAHGF